jgi:hypothetical protein
MNADDADQRGDHPSSDPRHPFIRGQQSERRSARSVHRRRETGAAADGGNHQVQSSIIRVAAVLHEVLGGLLARADVHELLAVVLVGVVFAEVGTQPALSVVNLQHGEAPFASSRMSIIWNVARPSFIESRVAKARRKMGSIQNGEPR